MTRGVYDISRELPTTVTGSRHLDDARRRAAWIGLLAHGPTAIAVGPCALALHGVRGLPVHLTPEVALPGGHFRPRRDGIIVRAFDVGNAVVPVAPGAPWQIAAPQVALAHAVPQLSMRHAVAVLDSALHLGLIDTSGVEEAHRLARGRRGVGRTHQWWSLADGRAESPLETWARLDCLAAGIPPDDLQVEIFDDIGNFLGRGDMGWRLPGGRWLIAEVDGTEFHDGLAPLYADRSRQNRMQALGKVTILRFTARDLRTPGLVAGQVKRFLDRIR